MSRAVLIHNERTNLLANTVNALGTTSIGAGVIAPLVARSFGVPGAPTIPLLALASISFTWLLVGIVLHVIAEAILGRLPA